jgi:16S rRNA (cytidine1402-2'-O)-methyltransferase
MSVALYLLPNVFDDTQPPFLLLPEGISSLIGQLDGLIAESERTGRRYLIKMLPNDPIARSLPIYLLNEHSSDADCEAIAESIAKGKKLGLISDAGLPTIADPGARLVRILRKKGIGEIKAIPGPSSIFLALMLSGLNAQKFTFHGYLPKEEQARAQLLRKMEKEPDRTHVFIETPYRNKLVFSEMLKVLSGSTMMAIASNLTFADESFDIHPMSVWRTLTSFMPRKVPSVFLIQADVCGMNT